LTGLEISREYFEQFGREAFSRDFPELFPFLCFGLCGPGSECYGFDDELSRDHDFEPGFCVFYPEELISDRDVFKLERAYAHLPAEFMGLKRSKISPYGGMQRRGIISISEYFLANTGFEKAPDQTDLESWLLLPEAGVSQALNGEIFLDNHGEFSRIRENFASMPSDLRLKRLAGRIFAFSQSGEYNYPRMVKRADGPAAQLCAYEAYKDAAYAAFLISGVFPPYFKWLPRALSALPEFPGLAEKLSGLILKDNSAENAAAKTELILNIGALLCDRSAAKFGIDPYTDSPDRLQHVAFALNELVSDNSLRNADILFAI